MKKRTILISLTVILFLLSFALLSSKTLDAACQLEWNPSRAYEEISGIDIYFNGDHLGEVESLGAFSMNEGTSFSDTYEFEFPLSATNTDYTDPTLCFRTYGTGTLVYQDSRQIYSLTSKSGGYSPASFDGGRYNLVHLDTSGDWKNSTIRIICSTSYDMAGHSFYPIYIGSRSALVWGIVCRNIPALSIGLVITILGALIGMLMAAVPSKKSRKSLISSIFLVLVTGFWIITQNWSKQLIISNVTVAIDLSYLMMALLPLATITYIEANFPLEIGIWKRELERFAYTIITVSVLMEIWYLFLHRPYDIFLTIIAVLLMIYFICLLAAAVYEYVKKRYDGGLALIAAIVLYIFPILTEQLLLVTQQSMPVQILIYLPYLAAILLLLFHAVRQSMKDSSNVEERKKAVMTAFTDPLTGLLNRNALENRLESREINGGLYIFMFDINGMKECNDTLGHAAGDRLLIAFAESLREATSDLNHYTFRYGGDEFLLMVEEDENYDADSLVKKIRTAFSSISPWPAYDFSYGLVRYSSAVRDDILASIRQADSRMYFDKYLEENNGKPRHL